MKLNEVAYSPDIVWITYGSDRFNPAKFKPIEIEAQDSGTNKPHDGGLWACPVNSEYGWDVFCRMAEWEDRLKSHFVFKLKPDARIYVVDGRKDLIDISTAMVPKPFNFWTVYQGNRSVKYPLYQIDYKRLLNEGYDGIYVTDNASGLREMAYEMPNGGFCRGLYAWDVESICIFNPDVIVPLEENEPVRLNESDIREMVRKCVSLIREGADFNIRGVYHVSSEDFNEFQLRYDRFPYLFFSSKPIYLAGAHNLYVCNLSMHNPLMFDGGMSWSYPLWLYLSNRYGELIPQEEFTRERYDGYLGAPYELWEMVYYDEDEYGSDQIPELVKRLNDEKGYNYDGVIIKGIDEGDRSEMVDDYVVFSPEQAQIVRKGKI